jgi:hypothetical protein
MTKTTFSRTMILFFTLLSVQPFMFGQTLIAGWDFQTTTNGGTAGAAKPNSPTVFVANVGTGTMYLNGTNGSSSWSASSELDSFSGTALNPGTGLSTTTTGTACLALLGGTSNSANGKFIVFKFSMTGLSNLIVSYATQKTSTGFSSQIWEYSTNGTTWLPIQTVTPPASFAVTTLNAVSGLNNTSTAYLRLNGTGATSASGNNRLDNIQLNATIITGLSEVQTLLKVTVENRNIKFSTSAGETIEVFNTAGQRLIQKKTVEGMNSIPVSAKGILIVKIGNHLAKVIM